MKTIAILYIGRHPEITETVVRLLNTYENWVGVGTVNDEEAKAIFCKKEFSSQTIHFHKRSCKLNPERTKRKNNKGIL